ncbi:hypothetical protein GWK08_06195 [Leptobacterium flavescens]|uniref:DUF4623 domain-containing protein n=1 Tax=Leptobacterium flavescens TaxID=472055 RepID=A0A6P0UI54_9FLAO|nr:beta-propeller fold lactonase family protein [Leptobacterium flavescens]NER13021.1 hypothetical protein [Leptobacterium flavescens]
MKQTELKKLALLLISMVAFTACKNDDDSTPQSPESERTLVGFLYTTTNGEQTNQVLRLDRYSDGSVGNEIAYPTGSDGGADTSAGGDANGDFDSQGAVQIIGDYLLNVNAGGNTISVFSLDRPTGDLTFQNNVTSGGTRPVSIAFTPKDGATDEYWVVVGNQWNNPNVQNDGPNLQRFPNDAFHNEDLTQSDATDAERNITLFSFNTSTGALTLERQLDSYVRENGGPTTVAFSDDGSKLAVSTWGIAHFATENPSLDEQRASRVYVYDFANGIISGERFFEEEGIAGTIGFNWARGSSSILQVSNFNLISSKLDNSLTILFDDGTTVTKNQNFNTVEEGDINEACWSALNPDGTVLYISSFGANAITAFNVDAAGNVSSEIGFEVRGGFAPPGDTKDIYISSDDAYLYNIGAFQSFSINTFSISDSGALSYEEQFTYETTSASVGSAGTFNFLGLSGYDLE